MVNYIHSSDLDSGGDGNEAFPTRAESKAGKVDAWAILAPTTFGWQRDRSAPLREDKAMGEGRKSSITMKQWQQ